MDIYECESCLKDLFASEVSASSIASASPLLFELHTLLDLEYEDIVYICYQCPELLHCDQSEFALNWTEISKFCDIKSKEMKYLYLKVPDLLKLKSVVFKYKINLVSTLFGVSFKEAVKMVYYYPELFSLKKEQVIKRIYFISKTFDDYGLSVRKHFRKEPRLLFATEENINVIKHILMTDFSLTEKETKHIFRTSPEVALMSKGQLTKFFEFLYPKYFIKRDLKEMINTCPEVLTLNKKTILRKIEEIKNVFSCSEKQACTILRKEPNLFFISALEKVKSFERLGVNPEYIMHYPNICMLPEIGMPLRLIITKILGLEKHFQKIAKMDLNLFVSRLLFMQSYNHFDHEDLVLDENEFAIKYNISSKVLLLSYRMDRATLENLISYYINLKDTLPGWLDLVFPNEQDVLDLLSSKFEESMHPSFFKKTGLGKNQYELCRVFDAFQMSQGEMSMIMLKNPTLNLYKSTNIIKIAEILRKNGYCKERIMSLFIKSPTLFTFLFKDFDEIITLLQEKNQNLSEILEELA